MATNELLIHWNFYFIFFCGIKRGENVKQFVGFEEFNLIGMFIMNDGLLAELLGIIEIS